MPDQKTIVHITHEAATRMGGIGQVVHGLLTCKTYLDATGRSIIIGPWFDRANTGVDAFSDEDEILYCSTDHRHDHSLSQRFAKIEHEFGVELIYGKRRFYEDATGVESFGEIVLIDVTNTVAHPVNALKRWLYDEFDIESNLYETHWDYEQYVRLAPAALAVLRALDAADPAHPAVLIAHEYMGLPTALAGVLDPLGAFKAVFHAHEVATVRRIVENSPGHDTMFYNALQRGLPKPHYLNEMFGPQEFFFKHALIKAARFCDNIVAVGDNVVNELSFLGAEFAHVPIDLAYNGVAGHQISLDEKLASRSLMQQYADNLLGFRPNYVFTHVTRLTPSKAIWRDLLVLAHLDKQFKKTGQTAVLFILSTNAPARHSLDIHHMEDQWGWPVAHREIDNDLTAAEASLHVGVQTFNARQSNIKIVFVNQFGWSPALCGSRMPNEMQFSDIRKGTDLEFGQSIYEPFGISVLEPLPYGGLCVVSSISGCLGFAHSLTEGHLPRNIITADYTQLDRPHEYDVPDILAIGHDERVAVEERVSRSIADEILGRLPTSDADVEALMQSGWQLARWMSWDNVCGKYFLPAIDRTYFNRRHRQIA